MGAGAYKFDIKRRIVVDGLIAGNDVYLRYDGKFAPQVLNRHEHIHNTWYTEETQKATEEIWNSLSESEKNAIFKQERYKKYAEMYKGNMELVKQEFIADVLAGMNSYTSRYTDTVESFWNNGETIDSFKVSEYTHSTDAGGVNDSASEDRHALFALKKPWHTGFPLRVVEELERRVERDARTSTKFITDTANWYTTKINGIEYFVIYSTE